MSSSSSSSSDSFHSLDISTSSLGTSLENLTLSGEDRECQEVLVPEAFREPQKGSLPCPEANCQIWVPKSDLVDHLSFNHYVETVEIDSTIEFELKDILEKDKVWKGTLICDRGCFYYVTLIYEEKWKKFTALAVCLEKNERVERFQIRNTSSQVMIKVLNPALHGTHFMMLCPIEDWNCGGDLRSIMGLTMPERVARTMGHAKNGHRVLKVAVKIIHADEHNF